MDICVLNPYFYPYKGGTEKVLLEVYSRLARKHNITVLTSAQNGENSEQIEHIRGIEVHRLKTLGVFLPGLPLPFLSFEGLNKAIRKQNADIYHINNRYQYFWFNLKNIKSCGKLALTIHNSLPMNIDPATDSLGLMYDKLWGWKLMRGADVITGVSRNAIDVTVPQSAIAKSHVIYNGVDYKNFKKINKIDGHVSSILNDLGFDGTTIICNGRLVPQKGQPYLMRAVSELAEKGRMFNLLLLGKGPMKMELVGLAKRLGISKRFEIRQDIGDDNLPYYYAAGDMMVLPSLYEPASLAAIESMACELPVIASKVGGLPEMLGTCGIYVKPRDTNGIKRAVSSLDGNKKLAAYLGKRGRKRAILRHSWDRISRQYEELFLNTIRF